MGRAVLAAILGVMAGCHALVPGADDDVRLPPDADDTAFDAPPLGPWGNVAPIGPGATDNLAEDDLTLRADELELVFAATPGTGGKDLYVMTRPDVAAPWSAPTPLTAINTAGVSDQTPRFSPDALTLYFGSPRTGTSDDVWYATRTDLGSPWSTPQRVPGVNSGSSDRWYGTCGGGTRYVMISNRTGDLDLYEGVVGQGPVVIAELSSTDNDLSPLVSEDCLTMYFSSDRTGDYVLYRAVRPDVASPWQLVGPVPGVDTPDAEQDPWVSADDRRLYFASTRDGEFDLYLATR